jgi:4-hydroxybenzoate polyprenyltransferase
MLAPLVCAPPEKRLLMALGAFAFIMGSSFILNQLQDRETDEMNEKCFFIGKGMISWKNAVTESIILAVLAIAISYYLGIRFFAGIFLFFIITGYFYNFKPFEWKNKPIAGLIGNILMGWIAFYLGVVLMSDHWWDFVVRALPYVLLNTSLYIFTTLPDREGDRKSGKITIGVLLSEKASIYTALVLFFAGMGAALILHDKVALVIFIASSFRYLKLVQYRNLEEIIKTTKWTLFISSVVVASFFPWFAVWILLAYIFTKIYYRIRFDLDYPNFRGE